MINSLNDTPIFFKDYYSKLLLIWSTTREPYRTLIYLKVLADLTDKYKNSSFAVDQFIFIKNNGKWLLNN